MKSIRQEEERLTGKSKPPIYITIAAFLSALILVVYTWSQENTRESKRTITPPDHQKVAMIRLPVNPTLDVPTPRPRSMFDWELDPKVGVAIGEYRIVGNTESPIFDSGVIEFKDVNFNSLVVKGEQKMGAKVYILSVRGTLEVAHTGEVDAVQVYEVKGNGNVKKVVMKSERPSSPVKYQTLTPVEEAVVIIFPKKGSVRAEGITFYKR